MCILFIAKNIHPDYPLVIAANRDEYFNRPTQSPHWWSEAPHIFAGKDLQAGGTWMGYSQHRQQQHQRIAAITNVRRLDLHKDGAKSRGEWVKRFLDIETADIETALQDFTKTLEQECHLYNPFNLLYGDATQLMVFNSVTQQSQRLGNGVHSISNGMLDAKWPKMQRGIERLTRYIASTTVLNTEDLFELLQDKQRAVPELLPDTGISAHFETLLSSIFIPPESLMQGTYGTRSSSVLIVDEKNNGLTMTSCDYRPEAD